MRLFFAGIIVLLAGSQEARSQGNLIRVRAGHTFKEEFPFEARYRFPAFTPGQIVFINGKASKIHPLNYDILYGGIATIQDNDTIILVDRSDYKYFRIGDDTICRVGKDRYLEVIAGYPNGKLALEDKYVIKRFDKKVSNGYGTLVEQTSSTHSLTNSGHGWMVYDQDILYTKLTHYFLIDNEGVAFRATKANFLRVFPKAKNALSAYLQRRPVDYRSRLDLLRLFEYCATAK